MKNKRISAKFGKQLAPLVSQNPAYSSNQTKIDRDPELKKFLEQTA